LAIVNPNVDLLIKMDSINSARKIKFMPMSNQNETTLDSAGVKVSKLLHKG